jgi:MFS family permease
MLWWISFFNYADRQAIFSLFPLLQSEFGIPEYQLGWLGSAFTWVYGLGAPFAGIVVDRVRRKAAILAGLHAWSGICMATALSRRFWHLIAFRAAEGLGETIYYPASVAMLSDYHGAKTRSRALGIHQTSVYVGTIAGAYLAGRIGQNRGWRSPFVMFGGLGVLLGIVLARFLREPVREQTEATAPKETISPPAPPLAALYDGLRIVLQNPTVVLHLLAFSGTIFGTAVLLIWTPKFLHDKFDLDLGMAGLNATLCPQAASMVGAVLGGWLADRLRGRLLGGRIVVQCAAVFCIPLFVYLCGRMDSLVGVLTVLTGWGLFKGIYDANIFASVFEVVPPESRGTIAGYLNMMGWMIGGTTAGPVIGYLAWYYHDLGRAISAAAPVYVVAGLLLAISLVSLKRDMAAQWNAHP